MWAGQLLDCRKLFASTQLLNYPIKSSKKAPSSFQDSTTIFQSNASICSCCFRALLVRYFTARMCLLRIQSENLEDTFLQTNPAQNGDPSGQEKVYSKHVQGNLSSQRRSGKQHTQCCTLTGLALGCQMLCTVPWANVPGKFGFDPNLLPFSQVSSKILINETKVALLLFYRVTGEAQRDC